MARHPKKQGRGDRRKQVRPTEPRVTKAKTLSDAAKRGWETRKRNQQAAADAKRKRSLAALKGWATRRAQDKAIRKGYVPSAPTTELPSAPIVVTTQSAKPEPMPLGARGFPEPKFFSHGDQLLGYLEGRPGVVALLAVEPWQLEEPFAEPHERRLRDAEVDARIRELPIVTDAADNDRDALIDSIEHAWDVLEDEGGIVTAEIDSDSL